MGPVEKMFNIMKKPWFISLYLILIVACYHWVDKSLAIYFHQFDFRTHTQLNYLTDLGKVPIYLALFTILGLYFRYLNSKAYEMKAWYMLGCILLPNLLSLILKVLLGRARPELWFSIQAFGFYGLKSQVLYWSFPSGHTTTVAALAAGLGVLFPRYFYLFLLYAIVIILTRVVLYYHYLSDVMAAFYLSFLMVGLYTRVFKSKIKLVDSRSENKKTEAYCYK